MANHFSKQLQQGRKNFDNLRAALVVRVWNLAKRLDQSHFKDELKKKKQHR